jgi:uncharacterized membrane protein
MGFNSAFEGLMIADKLHRCRGNSEYGNRNVPQESADIADTHAGIIWVCFVSEFNETDRQCTYKRNIKARPFNLSCSGEAISISHSVPSSLSYPACQAHAPYYTVT